MISDERKRELAEQEREAFEVGERSYYHWYHGLQPPERAYVEQLLEQLLSALGWA